MSATDDQSGQPDKALEQLRTRALQLLDEIESYKQKAQSEALFAFQAKQNCEEHSTFIAQKKGQVEADLNAIGANKKNIDEFAASIPVSRAAIDAEVKTMSTRRTESDESIAFILENRKKAENDSGALKELRASAEEANTAIRTLQQSSQASSDTSAANAATAMRIQAELTQMGTTAVAQLEAINRNETRITELVAKAKQDVANNEKTLAEVDQANKQYTALVANLNKLGGESEELRKRVEKLLPGATSAALASSFKQQTERFTVPKKSWISCFVTCIVLLLLIALPSFLNLIGDGKLPTWDSMLLEFVHRLPLVIPLVWLAIYSGHNYMMAVRLEEDYAYKEAVSRAFEGYKEQMQAIKGKPDTDDPLLVLCNNVLRALAERPGRIYEGKSEHVTPLTPLANAISQVGALKDRPGA
jgi:hypothetical protein